MPQVKLGDAAETIGKFGLAVAIVCFVAQTVIWFVNMSRKVRARGRPRRACGGKGKGPAGWCTYDSIDGVNGQPVPPRGEHPRARGVESTRRARVGRTHASPRWEGGAREREVARALRFARSWS